MIHFDSDNFPFRLGIETEAIQNPSDITYLVMGITSKYLVRSRTLLVCGGFCNYHELCLTYQKVHIKGVIVYDSIFYT